jgi:hypothetical protein
MMEQFGISWMHVLAQVEALTLFLGWLTITILALRHLRAYRFDSITTMLWAALIVLVPFVVALAFLRVRPPRIRPAATRRES